MVEVVAQGDHCGPNEPVTPTETQMCHGTIQIECCCPRLQTRTFLVPIGPNTVALIGSATCLFTALTLVPAIMVRRDRKA